MRIESLNVRKKARESPNVRKELSHVMLEMHNVRIKLSNVKKKVREPFNVTNNVRINLSNVRKK